MLRGFCLLLLFAIQLSAKEQVPLTIQLLSERHRTEWNWVEYRLKITNTSTTSIINPEVYYFTENTEDSSLVLDVDYVTYFYSTKVESFITGAYNIFQIKLTGVLQPSQSLDIHFRIHKNNWSAWDCSKDFSYQQKSVTQEPHYWVAVYDASKELLWGVDPVSGKRKSDVVLWYDRGGKSVIYPYSGDSTEILNPGRFWLLKETPLSSKERKLLKQNEIDDLEGSKYQGFSLYLLKVHSKQMKKILNENMYGFYNTFPVDDTTKLTLELLPEEENLDSLSITISCFADVSMEVCKSIAQNCGVKNVEIDHHEILGLLSKNQKDCLLEHNDIEYVGVVRLGAPLNDVGREAIHVTELQNSEEWKNYLKQKNADLEWLSNAGYTGEGIVVGVYDTGIDWSHPDFNEIDENGNMVPRKVRKEELFVKEKSKNNILKHMKEYNPSDPEEDEPWHATTVAGILGGNGSFSPEYKYRGVAPKVHFYSGRKNYYRQIGHVLNHSHTDACLLRADSNNCFLFWYAKSVGTIDESIFDDWKTLTEYGDTLTKAVVVGAGNNGYASPEEKYGYQIGYHSILSNSKNAITVGNYSALTGIRFSESSMGPTWDGRIKPDVMAPGAEFELVETSIIPIHSPYPCNVKTMDNCYFNAEAGGTSMSAPFVSGIAALIYQRYREITGIPLEKKSLRNSTIKAMLIHTAEDMEVSITEEIKKYMRPNPDITHSENDGNNYYTPYGKGPDFATGWGKVNAKKALQVLEENRFLETEIANGVEKRWNLYIAPNKDAFRVTMVWDDAPGKEDSDENPELTIHNSKLVNDLDMYLISPSGKYFYPWKLNPLPTESIYFNGNLNNDVKRIRGLEKIKLNDIQDAARDCNKPYKLDSECFDHLNNVEVVDVDNPESGIWQVVVMGTSVTQGNGILDTSAQVVSLASDVSLNDSICGVVSPYPPMSTLQCEYDLGDNLENYVTFGAEAALGSGDTIYIYDAKDKLLGKYAGSSLAGKRIAFHTNKLKIVLDSDNEDTRDFGYRIKKIESLPYTILPILFKAATE
ncbi:MAG: S8 family serine peptidase [Fibrobacteraceae bacterium]|nr:S8 family serine peptidase [Fibrobacteraceae bacterium]